MWYFWLLVGVIIGVALAGYGAVTASRAKDAETRAYIRDILERPPERWLHQNNIYEGISLPGGMSDLVYAGGTLRIENRGTATIRYWLTKPRDP
jgi:hypothetical protein